MRELERGIRAADRAVLETVPPSSEDAETAVIAGMIYGTPEQREALAAAVPDASYIYDPHRSLIYGAALRLLRSGVQPEARAVAAALQSSGASEAVMDALADALDAEVLAANASWYAGQVTAAWRLRQTIEACTAATRAALSPGAVAGMQGDVVGDLQARLQTIGEAGGEAGPDFRADVKGAFRALEADALHAGPTGIPTGYAALDRLTGGWHPTDLAILAARPACGKTALALQFGLAAARGGRRVLICSLEMSRQQLIGRLLSILSGVAAEKIRRPRFLTPQDWTALYAVGARLRSLPIVIVDRSGMRPMDIRRTAADMLRTGGAPELIIVDYLQYMAGDKRSYYNTAAEVSDISSSLKRIARDLEIPVIALAQLNRKLEEREDKRPILSDLRESGAIEQDADVIMFLHREDIYRRRPDGMRPLDSVAELHVAKQRSGPTGMVRLLFHAPCTEYCGLESCWTPPQEASTF